MFFAKDYNLFLLILWKFRNSYFQRTFLKRPFLPLSHAICEILYKINVDGLGLKQFDLNNYDLNLCVSRSFLILKFGQ